MAKRQLKRGNFRGERLKQSRQSAGYKSARAFARDNNLNEITYSQHEAGRRSCDLNDIEHYAKLLKVNPAWLSFESVNNPHLSEQKTLWTFTLPVSGIIRNRPVTVSQLKQKRIGSFSMPITDASAHHLFVYRIPDVGTSVTPSGGHAFAICAPFLRDDVHSGSHVVVAVREPKSSKYVVTVGEIVGIRPEYFSVRIKDQKHPIVASNRVKSNYKGIILARALAVHRPL